MPGRYLFITDEDAPPVRGTARRVQGNAWVGADNDSTGQIYQRLYSGGGWAAYDPAFALGFGAVKDIRWFADNDVYILTTGPQISHWDGASWTDTSFPGTGTVWQLCGTSGSALSAVTLGSDSLHRDFDVYDWNGSAWSGPTNYLLTAGSFTDVTRAQRAPSGDRRIGTPGTIANLDSLTVEWTGTGIASGLALLSNSSGFATITNNNNSGSTHGDSGILQYSGGSWGYMGTQPSYPDNVNDNIDLFGIDATSTTNVWACGTYNAASTSNHQLLVLQWDGSSWTNHYIGVNTTRARQFNDIRVLSSTDVWAVGVHRDTSNVPHPVEYHWDGSSWSDLSFS